MTVKSDSWTQRIVWVDCEMTGLDTENDVLIEVAALVTDHDLNVLGEGVDVVIKPTQDKIDGMNDFVRNMHTESGLLEDLAGGVTLAQAEQAVLKYLNEWLYEAGKVPLAGNSIATDRAFIARYMPELDKFLHYRMIDVSSIKELAKRWYPRAYFAAPGKTGNHRALGDIQDSIAELRYYRSTVFVDQPGPDSTQAREAAAVQESEAGEFPANDPVGASECAQTKD